MGKKRKPDPLAVAFRAGRKAKGLTTKEIAIRSGVHRTTVSQWENGHRELGASKVAKLLDAAGMLRPVLRLMKEPKK